MSASRARRSLHRDRGLTIIELVAAMAIFALVSVMGLQSLTGSMRMRDRLMTLDRETGEVSMTLALLRHDLEALVPMLFHPPGSAPRSAIDLSRDGTVLALSLDGQPMMPGVGGSGQARVEWRVDSAGTRLTRRVWPTLFPASAAAAPEEFEVLSDVTGMTLRSYWPQTGWEPGVTSNAPREPVELSSDSDGARTLIAESYSGSLPLAIEVVLETTRLGRIRLVETLQ